MASSTPEIVNHRNHAALAASASRRTPSWGSAISQSFRQADEEDPFRRAQSVQGHDDDEENLRWAALEKLPTYDRMRRGVVRSSLLHDDDDDGSTAAVEFVDVGRLASGDAARALVERLFQDDSERFLCRLKDRIDMVGIELPKIEIRYEQLSVEADAFVASRALPTLSNAAINFLQAQFVNCVRLIGRFGSSNKTINILKKANGILKPSRMTLLLGPPSSGKSTLMRALTNKLDKNLKVSGNITYCGHKFSEFCPERTSAYVSQYDLHNAEMTVRETLDFSRRCLGIGSRYDMLAEISRRERNAGIKPDPEIDAFVKATAMQGQESNIITDVILKALGLDICADIIVGDDMMRGISGGQKKRVTTGEMLTGPAGALLMDEISTGLDSSSTFQIVKFIKQLVHVMNETVMISLLQPPPETYNLFDDIVLLSEGCIVYHGPREHILEFFEASGFRCPQRKGVADFLQEVTSKKDQQQYWYLDQEPYRYVTVLEFAERFKLFRIGQQMLKDLHVPFEKSNTHRAALTTMKNALSNWESLKAVMSREKLLMKRNSFIYIFKVTKLIILAFMSMTVFLRTKMPYGQISDGTKFLGALTFNLITVMFNGLSELNMTIKKLPMFYKHRDFLFFPAWTYGLANILLKVPVSLVEAAVWVVMTYYVMGFSPAAGRFFRQFLAFFTTHLMAMALFRFLGAISKTMVVANTFGMFVLLIVFVFGGFPNNDTTIDAQTIGKAILKSKGMFTEEWGFWLSIGALVGFILLFNTLYILALTFLSPIRSVNTLVLDEDSKTELYKKSRNKEHMSHIVYNDGSLVTSTTTSITMSTNRAQNRPNQPEVVLPFQPLSLCFNHLNYYVDMPSEMKEQGLTESHLQLLSDISGAFRPGVLTALVGVSGAGKTTLMDVLAGRKTSGTIEGSITVAGYPKKQETFARISGYCEQADIHSPNVTVYESIVYSAWLRLSSDVDSNTRKMFVEEVMALVELDVLSNAMVGLPGVDGLSTEQRKRLTIAVELVANPSIIFMDEPTSGLDARAAAIVMRTIRNTVNTGRTVVCTIHQPSIDIFESFDEAIPGIGSITKGYNPATWMLEVSSTLAETHMNVDFAEIYANSLLYRDTQQDLYNLLGATYAAIFFIGATNCMSVQPVVSIERAVLYRESAAGMYSPLSYAFAQASVEFIYNSLQAILYTVIIYAMIGYDWKANKFFYFLFFIVSSFNYFTFFGMMLVACTPSALLANILITFALPLWNLFAGFLIVRKALPIWWRWYYWANPVSWTIYGVIASQFGENSGSFSVTDGKPVEIKQFLDDNLGIQHDFLGYVILAHFGYMVAFVVIFGYSINFLNFQKR
uniref:ABC transporter domain-containing protein n=1 Tax=Leersia perrieri TaxID=77586 RepID=A0A0D9VF50_9ORYZ